MLAEERKKLLPLPMIPFDPSKSISARVHSDLTVRHDSIKYSVPASLAGRYVTLRVTPFNVFVHAGGEMVYPHCRSYDKDAHQYIPEHYLELLEKKPRAINQALPLTKGIMPQELLDFQRLYRGKDTNHQLVAILQLGRSINREKLLWAVQMANKSGTPSFSLICFYLDIQSDISSKASSITVDRVNLEQYDQLMMKGGKPNNESNG